MKENTMILAPTSYWVWFYLILQKVTDAHLYRLTNGHGCMETDSNPYKWAWFTKDAMTHYFSSTLSIYFACNPIWVQPYKVYG